MRTLGHADLVLSTVLGGVTVRLGGAHTVRDMATRASPFSWESKDFLEESMRSTVPSRQAAHG